MKTLIGLLAIVLVACGTQGTSKPSKDGGYAFVGNDASSQPDDTFISPLGEVSNTDGGVTDEDASASTPVEVSTKDPCKEINLVSQYKEKDSFAIMTIGKRSLTDTCEVTKSNESGTIVFTGTTMPLEYTSHEGGMTTYITLSCLADGTVVTHVWDVDIDVTRQWIPLQ